jgi:predicted AlkP superfamily phosphohydrolase/phosphomutase
VPSQPRLLILALDGATFDLIGPWVEQGKLPTFARLIRGGVHGALRSTTPPITPCAWTSFSTAQNPGRHGIFDFQQFVPGTYELAPTNGAMRKARTIWEYLNDLGLTVGLYNLPWMYPPPRLNGYCVCGFDAPDINPKAVHPPDLSRELHAAVPGISLAAEFLKKRNGEYDLDALRRQVRVNIDAARFLLEKHPVDVCLLTFMLLDQVAHFFYYADPALRGARRLEGPHGPGGSTRPAVDVPDVLLAVHQWVDEGLAEILDLIPPDCLVIGVSDHGVAPTTIHLNPSRALADAGLLAFAVPGTALYQRAAVPGRSPSAVPPSPSPVTSLKRLLSSILPQSLWLRLRRARHARRSRERFAAVDWSRTKAFSWGNFAQVRLNLVGREPRGIVKPADADEVIAEVKRVLLDLRDPATGEPLFSDALTPSELYSGPHTEGAADVLGIPAHPGVDASLHVPRPDAPLIVEHDAALMASPEMADKVAGHSPDGILFATGALFRQNAVLAGARIYDVLPTALYALGLDLPSDLDGHSLEDAFDPAFLSANPPRYSDRRLGPSAPTEDAGYSDEDLDAVEQRLRDLGYM